MKKLLEVTYTVTVPEDITEEDCGRARAEFGYSLAKNLRRMEAVTLGLRHLAPPFKAAKLATSISPEPVQYEKGATARRVVEVKNAAKRRACE